VPFFVLAGEIMGRGGIANRVVTWVVSIVGGVRGSLAVTTVASSELFGAMAHTSVGTVVDVAVGVNVIVAAVLGGRRTVLGAALGAIFLIVAGEFLRPTGELATFIVSAVALLVVLFFPGGFLGAALSHEGR